VGENAASHTASALAGQDVEDVLARVLHAHERILREGEALFQSGDPSGAVYIVQSGSIELQVVGPKQPPRLVGRAGPGDTVGEVDTLLDRPRVAHAVAVQAARVLELDRDIFQAMCQERPEIAWRLLTRSARHIEGLERRLAALGMEDLVRPLVGALLDRARQGSDGLRAETSLRSLADAAGLSIRDAHHALHDLFERKLIRLQEDVLVIPDADALRARLAGSRCAPATPRPR
jgi:CRP/FNR family cyclic AMP-dependent transcriptional regulator